MKVARHRWGIGSLLVLAALCLPARAAELTPTEVRWLEGAWPVVRHARQSGMPLDIVVQPQPMTGVPPLALAFIEGRCKLVLSMRGNPQAQETLDRIEPELLAVTIELMAAHELGHCRRYLDGTWFTLPAAFMPAATEVPGADPRSAQAAMQSARREEGYADLVGLAWTEQHHPQLYARLHAWLLAERSADRTPGSPHDTLAWVRRAQHGVLRGHASLFAAVDAPWQAALLDQD